MYTNGQRIGWMTNIIVKALKIIQKDPYAPILQTEKEEGFEKSSVADPGQATQTVNVQQPEKVLW